MNLSPKYGTGPAEIRYEPVPRPEEVERWITIACRDVAEQAYLAGVEDGRNLKDPDPQRRSS